MKDMSLEEIQTMIRVEICKHFHKRTDYVFGYDSKLIRIEECDTHYKLWIGKRDYKYCSDMNDVMEELTKIFNKDSVDEQVSES